MVFHVSDLVPLLELLCALWRYLGDDLGDIDKLCAQNFTQRINVCLLEQRAGWFFAVGLVLFPVLLLTGD